MSFDDVVKSEQNTKYTIYGADYYGVENFKSVEYTNEKAAGEKATVTYNFLYNTLAGIILVFDNNADINSVSTALVTKYGDPIEIDVDRFLTDISVTFPGREGIYSFFVSMSETKAWQLSSTYIVFLKDMGQLFYFGENEIGKYSLQDIERVINTEGI